MAWKLIKCKKAIKEFCHTKCVNYMHQGGVCMGIFLLNQVCRICYEVIKYNLIIKSQERNLDVKVDRKNPKLVNVHPSIDKWESLNGT